MGNNYFLIIKLSQMRLAYLFVCCLLSLVVTAQNNQLKDSISFSTQGGVLFFANKSFDNLSRVVSKSGTVDAPQNIYSAIGVSLILEKPKYATEFNALFFRSAVDNSNIKRFAFLIDGLTIKTLMKNKFFDRKRFSTTFYLGFSQTYINFRLVDKITNTTSFDTLLVKPSLSSTLNMKSKGVIFNLDTGLDLEYKTGLFKNFLNGFNIGLRVGYSQPVFASKEIIYAGTTNGAVSNFPKMSYNNVFSQILFKITFKEPPPSKKQKK